MLKTLPLSLLFTFSAAPVLDQPLPLSPVTINTTVEAQTARELNTITPAILGQRTGSDSDSVKMRLALAYARLGRLEAGLKAANALESKDPIVTGGAPLTRDEVRRIVVVRRAILGKVPEAQQLASEIKNPRLHASALLAVARAQTREGKKLDAQKTLFEALKLIGPDKTGQMYIAVLLYRAADVDASKRLLSRIEKSLPALKPNKPFAQRTEAELLTQSESSYLAWALFQSGQEQKSSEFDTDSRGRPTNNMLGALIRKGYIDFTEKLARQSPSEQSQQMQLLAIAWGIRNTQPERAKALITEVNELLHNTPDDAESPFKGSSFPSRKNLTLIFVAGLFRELGQEDQAQTILKEATDASSPEAATYLRLAFALAPLTLEYPDRMRPPTSTTYSPDKIENISRQVNALLPTANLSQFDGILPTFINAQIATGAVETVRQTLELLGANTLTGRNASQNLSDVNRLNPALDIAQGWQRLGDTQQLNAYLNRLWDSPLAKAVKPVDHVWKLIDSGFIDEGKRRLASLGVAPDEGLYQYPSIAYFEGKYTPTTFPTWISGVAEPKKKLAVLGEFAHGLTESMYQSRTESEFDLLANGSSYRLSY